MADVQYPNVRIHVKDGVVNRQLLENGDALRAYHKYNNHSLGMTGRLIE